MKEIIILQEQLALMDRELRTLTEKLSALEKDLKVVNDLALDVKGLKVYLGRIYPEFKSQFPAIIKEAAGLMKTCNFGSYERHVAYITA